MVQRVQSVDQFVLAGRDKVKCGGQGVNWFMEKGIGFNEKIKCVVQLAPLAVQAGLSVAKIYHSAQFFIQRNC